MQLVETVLITGASSGIGLELARLFATDSSRLILLARSEGRLRRLASELEQEHDAEVHVLAADLSRPDAPENILERLRADRLEVDVLVNNAGFGARGPFAALDLQRQLDMVQVNVNAVTHLSRLMLPDMVRRRKGGIINVASTAAFQPGPAMAVYYATKAYVLSFSEALYEEVNGHGVTITCLAPGPTKTEFAERAGTSSRLISKVSPATAASVALAGYKGYRSGKPLVVPGLTNRLGSILVQVAPRAAVRKVIRFLNETEAG